LVVVAIITHFIINHKNGTTQVIAWETSFNTAYCYVRHATQVSIIH